MGNTCTCACDDEFGQELSANSPRVPRVFPMDIAGNEGIFNFSTLERAPMEGCPPRRPLGDMPAPFPRIGSGMNMKDMEKAKIIRVMKDFTARTCAGVNVWTVDAHTGAVFPARYTLTRDMSHILVSVSGSPDVCHDIDKIVGVSWGYETWPGLPATFASQLESDMLKRLVLLQFTDESIYLIENTFEKAEATVTALCVLCSYHSQKHGDPEARTVI